MKIIKYGSLLLAMLLLTGCADSVSFEMAEKMMSVGFLHGLWHGMIAPIAFFGSLFASDIAIYAIYNNGGWYDFGYILGIGALIGSSSF